MRESGHADRPGRTGPSGAEDREGDVVDAEPDRRQLEELVGEKYLPESGAARRLVTTYDGAHSHRISARIDLSHVQDLRSVELRVVAV